MKKLITIILILALALPALALADLPDVSGYTDQELKDLIAMCSAELRSRATVSPEGILLFEFEGIRLYQTSEVKYNGDTYLNIPVAIYNDTDQDVSIDPFNAICNGWDIFSNGIRVSAKAKNKGTLTFSMKDADVNSLDQIESLTFKWRVVFSSPFKVAYDQEEPEEHRFW